MKNKQEFTILFQDSNELHKKGKKGLKQKGQTANEGEKGFSLIKLGTNYTFNQAKILENEYLQTCDMKTLPLRAKNK